jgi:hypothetical protein
MEADFCVEALQEAIARHGRPQIFNTDQGVQFTSAGPSIDWGIMNGAIRPVGYVAGWGLVDGMDATFGWDRD